MEFNFDSSWLLVGVPKTLTKNIINVVNIEITLVLFFIFQSRLKKKLPLNSNLLEFMSFQRKFLLKNKNYKLGYEKLTTYQFDPG